MTNKFEDTYTNITIETSMIHLLQCTLNRKKGING